MRNTIICIGREFGSGGHEIAVQLGQKLNLKVYEKNLTGIACKFGEISEKRLAASDERAANPYLYETVHEGNYHVIRGLPTSEVLFQLQSHEIRRIANEQDCIFVGRCADFVLKDADIQCIRVFVSAPFEDRVRRKMQQEKLTSKERTRRLVRKMDRQRSQYYNHFTGQKWGDPENYDLYIDCGITGIEGAVELICNKYVSAKDVAVF